MRISDWSSDVCSSDLTLRIERVGLAAQDVGQWMAIDRQRLVLGQPAVDLLIANRQDLRRERADGLAERDAQIVGKIGKESCRERGCSYVLFSVVAVALKKRNDIV